MNLLGIFSILFGLIIIAYPQFLAYLIGFFFLIVGLNMVILPYLVRRKWSSSANSWKVGGYEIIKKK